MFNRFFTDPKYRMRQIKNSLIVVIGALLVISNIASLFYQGIKDAIKGLIVEGVLLGIIYLISTTLGSDMDMTKLLIYAGIMIICIPILLVKIIRSIFRKK